MTILGLEVRALTFDPVQTHAVYGVSKDLLEQVKSELKSKGAKRIRVVMNKHYPSLNIVCFKGPLQ